MNAFELAEKITVNTQSSIRIEGGKTVYFDPIGIGEQRKDADIVFITHEHGDHFEPASIRNISRKDTVFVFPESMKEQASAEGFASENTVFMNPGEKTTVREVPVVAVPAYNLIKPFHPKRRGWLGYKILIDGVSVYYSGDSDATKEMSAVKCDIALLPIGGKFTMNAKEAAKAAGNIRPAVCIPVHYGSIVGKPEDEKEFAAALPDGIEMQKKLF